MSLIYSRSLTLTQVASIPSYNKAMVYNIRFTVDHSQTDDAARIKILQNGSPVYDSGNFYSNLPVNKSFTIPANSGTITFQVQGMVVSGSNTDALFISTTQPCTQSLSLA